MSRRQPSPDATLWRVLVRFLMLFTVSMLLLVALWPWIAPTYSRWVAEAVRIGLRWMEPTQVSVVASRGAELWIYRVVSPGQIRPYTWFDQYTLFGLIPLVALLVATPGLTLRRRLGWTAAGIAGLFLTQAVYLVVSLQLSYIALGLAQSGPFLARTLNGWQVLARLLWEAAPLGWWVALTAGVWLRRLRAARPPGERSWTAPQGTNAQNVCAAREGRTA